MKGRKGLAPENFLEEVALFRSASHRSLLSSAGGSQSQPVSAASSRPSSAGVKTPRSGSAKQRVTGIAQV